MPIMKYVIPECPECHYKMRSAGHWEGDVAIFIPHKVIDCPKCKKGKIWIPADTLAGMGYMLKDIFKKIFK